MSGDDAHEPIPLPVALVRVTGVLLVGLAAWRFAADHLINPNGDVTSFTVERRLEQTWWQFGEWSFLTLAVVHGGLGVHWAISRRNLRPNVRLAVEAVSGAFVGVLYLSASLVLFAG